MARSQGKPEDRFADYVGEPIDSFYNKEVCGTMPVQAARGEANAPLPFGSALAGILLGQLVASRQETGGVRRFRMDFIRGLGSPQRTSPRPRENCLCCGRAAMRGAYAARWGTG